MTEPLEIQPYVEGEQEEIQEFKNEFDIAGLLETVGTLSDEVVEVARERGLWEPVNDEDVEIRPDGLIYVPWTVYAGRLSKAFPLQWGLVPQGMPKVHGNFVVWGFWLVIRGVLCGFAIGEQAYQPNNSRMTWTDAVEGAKSNALMRLCKGVGLFPELWTPSYIREWKPKYAEQYTDDRGKRVWRLKSGKVREKADDVIDAEPVKESGDKLVYPLHGDVVKKLVDLGLFENGYSAAKVIGPIFTVDGKMPQVSLRDVVTKATLYRQWKDKLKAEGVEDATAVAIQNAINETPIK